MNFELSYEEMYMKNIVIDGIKFSDLEGFYTEIDKEEIIQINLRLIGFLLFVYQTLFQKRILIGR